MIKKVVEIPSEERLLFEVDYPVDWENQKWEVYTIGFEDVFIYEIHEGPFAGSPTILDTTEIDKDNNGISTFKLDTNAGYRIIKCRDISIIKGKIFG